MPPGILDRPTVCRLSATGSAPDLLSAAREATTVPVVDVGPTGARGLEPLLVATDGGRTGFFSACTPSRAADVAARLEDDGIPADAADAVVDHEATPRTLPVPETTPLGVGTRSILARCGWVRPTDPDDYRASGGFETLAAEPARVLDAARDVRGRGWGDAAADEPVGESWARVAEAAGDPAIVVNAHGSPGDALLCESVPFLPIEGALAAARVVGATEVVVYLAAGDERARERVEGAVEELPEEAAGPDVRVATGPEAYRAAEPTMALEAIEGADRLEARRRPPGPDVAGLHGRPTLVHTPRTLAQVVLAAAGVEPTRVVTVRGDVRDEATVELPEGYSLSILREAVVPDDGIKAARVGGRFGGLVPTLDVAASPDALEAAGLGTDGVVEILGEGRCVVAEVGEGARFGRDANCGRCVPCREGSKQLVSLLRGVYDGRFERAALDELLRVVRSTSLCGFGRDLTRPIATALDAFEDEFAAHAAGECPAGTCTTGAAEVAT